MENTIPQGNRENIVLSPRPSPHHYAPSCHRRLAACNLYYCMQNIKIFCSVFASLCLNDELQCDEDLIGWSSNKEVLGGGTPKAKLRL
jgi:hypothetical protein